MADIGVTQLLTNLQHLQLQDVCVSTDSDVYGKVAVLQGNLQGVELAVRYGGHLDTLLDYAVQSNQIAICDYLIQCEAKVHPDHLRYSLSHSMRALLEDALRYQ
jgi:hypothetical protein